jgi:glucokinase
MPGMESPAEMSGRPTIALDLGGTQVRAALVHDGRVLRRAAMKTDVAGGPAAVMEQFSALVGRITDEDTMRGVGGIGICSAGPLDTETGVVLDIPTIPGWRNFPFRDAAATRFALPAILENDAIAAAVGEWRHGAGQGLRHLVYATISTGIGGGVIADGRVLRGRKGMAGHIGHIRLMQDGPRCFCGTPGCFEALASGSALGARAREAADRNPSGFLGMASRSESVDARHVIAGARQGDGECLTMIDAQARYLGQGFTAAIHAFSPERVIMGGGVSQGFDLLAPGIHAVIRRDAVTPFRDVEVVPAALGDDAGLVGAASLVAALPPQA